MKHTATTLLALAFVSALAAAASADPWYAKGSHYAGTAGLWNNDAGNELFDDGLHGDGAASDGVFGGSVVSDQAAAKHEFKIALADWSVAYPGCNSWVHTSGPGDIVHFTYDGNTYNDGWYPSTNIVWSDHYAPPGTTFEVIGSAPETGNWTSGVAASLNGGLWTVDVVIVNAGSYEAKFRATGTWDVCNVGSETNTPCGGNIAYTTADPNKTVRFEFNPENGRTRAFVVDATPALPSTWGRVKQLYR